MKRLRLVCIFVILTHNLYAQLSNQTVGQRPDGSLLSVEGYLFPERIQSFEIEPTGKFICLYLRKLNPTGEYLKNKGKIAILSLEQGKFLWKKSINYTIDKPSFNSYGMLLQSGRRCQLLEINSGKKKWEQNIDITQSEVSLGLLLGYKTSDKLSAIRLRDGITAWEQEMPHKYGWQGNYRIDSIQRLIITDNIYRLNLLTGQMLELKAKTGIHDTKGNVLKGLACLATGVATAAISGGAYMGYAIAPGTSIINHLISDPIYEDSCYYFADRQNITCFNDTMGIIWQTKLPEKKASFSRLFLIGNKLYMLNRGFGLKDGREMKKCGYPFIACFNKQNGEQESFYQLSDDKRIIRDFMLRGDTLHTLYEDGITRQQLEDRYKRENSWNTKLHKRLLWIHTDTIYWFDASKNTLTPLSSNKQNLLVSNEDNTFYEINDNLKVNKIYSGTLVHECCLYIDDYILVRNNSNFRIIHKSGKEILRFKTGLRCVRRINNQLIVLNEENELQFIDLDDLFYEPTLLSSTQ